MSEQKVYDKAREMEREARAVEEAEAFDEAADRASLEVVLDQDDAQAIVTREGQDPQGLGGEAIERGPAGMRPEVHVTPGYVVTGGHFVPTTPTEGPAPRAWAAPGADDGMRVPEQSDLQGGATDCGKSASTLTDPEGAS